MKKYELLYIIPSQFTDAEVEALQPKIAALLEKHGAKVFKNDSLGKIRLAYPVKGVRHGTYVLVYFEAEHEAVQPIEHELRLADEVLRSTIVTLPKGAEEREVKIESYVAPLSDEARAEKRDEESSAPAPRAAASVPAPAIAPPVPATAADVPSMSIEELDQKLDKILEEDVKAV